MRYRLSTLLLVVTALCLGLGGFLSGYRTGYKTGVESGHTIGWHQATDRQMVWMAYYVNDGNWDYLGDLIAKYGFVNIISYHGYKSPQDHQTYRKAHQFDEKWPGIKNWHENMIR